MIKNLLKKLFNKINSLTRKSRWYNEMLFPDCEKFLEHNTFNLDVVNLGSTSGLYAFNYDGNSIKAANWALRHNPLACDEAILKNYVSYLKPNGAYVLISLCPFSSLSGSYDYFEDRYYTILYSSSIPHFSKKKKDEVMLRYRYPFKYMPLFYMCQDLLISIKRLFKKDTPSIKPSDFPSDAKIWYNNWLREFGLRSFEDELSLINKDSVNDAVIHINNMVECCKEHNAQAVLVIPPMHHHLASLFSSEARKILIESLLDKIDDHQIKFLNYMDDDMSNDTSMFLNSFFLNKKGAKFFTDKVLADLEIIQR